MLLVHLWEFMNAFFCFHEWFLYVFICPRLFVRQIDQFLCLAWRCSISSIMEYNFLYLHASWSVVGKQPCRTSCCKPYRWYEQFEQHLLSIRYLGGCFGSLTVGFYLVPPCDAHQLPCIPCCRCYLGFNRSSKCDIISKGIVIHCLHMEMRFMASSSFAFSHMYGFSCVSGMLGLYFLIFTVCWQISWCIHLMVPVLRFFLYNSDYLNTIYLNRNYMQYYTPYFVTTFCDASLYVLVVVWNGLLCSLCVRKVHFKGNQWITKSVHIYVPHEDP